MLAALVATHADFLPAQLLQAHNHAWWRRFEQARREFGSILERDPDNESALVGRMAGETGGRAAAFSISNRRPFHRPAPAAPRR
jgi:hypothetical protein